MGDNYKSVAVLERDNTGDTLVSWCYPSIDKNEEEILLSRSSLLNLSSISNYSFSKYKNIWFYVYWVQMDTSTQGSNITHFAVCLLTKAFNPEKYEYLCKLLAKSYVASGSILKIMEGFLSALTRSSWDCGTLGKFNDSDFEYKQALLASSVKDIVNILGMQIILVWTALLLKKRIVVYCDNVKELLKVVRALPLFVSHRQNWDILRPFVNGSKPELEDLQSAGVYVAGFIDPVKANDSSLIYDIYIDVPAQIITVADNAKADFMMGNLHKELATFLVKSAEDKNQSEQDLIKGLGVKTKDLIQNLKSLCTQNNDGSYILTMEMLKDKKLPRNMDRFLYNLGIAENLVKTQ